MYIKVEHAKIEQFQNKKIILFGASSTGWKAIEEFQRIGAEVIGFADNDERKQGTRFCQQIVYSPQQVKKMTQEDASIYVMITSIYAKEIKEKLDAMHVNHVYIVRVGVLHEKLPYDRFSNEILSAKESNRRMAEMIRSKEPCFVGRIGSTELETICNYQYFTGRSRDSGVPYTQNITNMLCDWTGFFPAEHTAMDRFCELYLKKIKEADMLWCMWESFYEDRLYRDFCPQTKLTRYDETGFPLYDEEPWTYALEGKKVLVIHPFDVSIRQNYRRKEALFDNKRFLPDFELKTLRAVQTLADHKDVPYRDWFEALEYMEAQMQEIDFDVALIGAGAYGFPLAAFAKSIGKQAFHIGGMLQLYFGIRGKYYDKFHYHKESWSRPLETERPSGYQKVEEGRYW